MKKEVKIALIVGIVTLLIGVGIGYLIGAKVKTKSDSPVSKLDNEVEEVLKKMNLSTKKLETFLAEYTDGLNVGDDLFKINLNEFMRLNTKVDSLAFKIETPYRSYEDSISVVKYDDYEKEFKKWFGKPLTDDYLCMRLKIENANQPIPEDYDFQKCDETDKSTCYIELAELGTKTKPTVTLEYKELKDNTISGTIYYSYGKIKIDYDFELKYRVEEENYFLESLIKTKMNI